MKAKLLLITIAVFFLCSFASAQGYDIRTTSRNNLRAAPSLDGTFLETVPSGTVLHVIGSFGRWLKISRNGNEVWMADWVGYSRVESSAGAAPQPVSNVPANVDNCCFVDRQCHSAGDWENGYWAFQNGQCAAPPQSQPQQQTPTRPASSVAAQVDNCCFVDRQCHTEADWTDGYHAFQNNQCPVSAGAQPGAVASSPAPSPAGIPLSTPYMTEGVRLLLANPSADPFNNCCHMRYQDKNCSGDAEWEEGYWAYQNRQCIAPAPLGTRPSIEGNATFLNIVESALDLIGTHAPDWLNYIYISGTRTIALHPPGGANGYLNRTWTIASEDRDWMIDHDFLVGFAGFIAHEACHSIQQRTYSQSAGWTNEAACVEAQLAVIEAINPKSRDVWWLRDLIANIQNPDRWWW
ncbi:MAG: SH3 domain-containing protein [Chloroflexi bacterium]|nr:SH3 domain-containing protein [Chloroflexota bacterium]